MVNLAVTDPVARSTAGSFRLRLIAAFFAIYFLWGTTFLAIRIAVQELPPLFAAGVRFLIAGVVLYGFMLVKGQASPTRTQWRNLACMAVLMFVVVYGMLFWAEKYVPSGIASVLEATIPILTLVIEMIVLRQQRFRWAILFSTVLGFCAQPLDGVAAFKTSDRRRGHDAGRRNAACALRWVRRDAPNPSYFFA